MENNELVECGLIAVREKMMIDADIIDCDYKMFQRRLHVPGKDVAYGATVTILNGFITAAQEAPKGTTVLKFPVVTHGIKWRCQARLYIDKPTSLRCIEFSEAEGP
jgi:hypothetical protein